MIVQLKSAFLFHLNFSTGDHLNIPEKHTCWLTKMASEGKCRERETGKGSEDTKWAGRL